MNALKSIWNSFKGTVKGFDTSRQLALGVAIGLMIGLIPKDSLLPYAIALVGILSRANLLSLGLSAVVFSWASPLIDPVLHRLGHWALTYDSLQSTWTWLYQIPVIPWTRFDNTVVMGALLAGLALCIPVHFISRMLFEKFGSLIAKALLNTRLATWLIGDPAPNPQKS